MLNEVLESCKYVIDNTDNITINYQNIDNLIKEIDTKNLKFWLYNNPYDIFDLGIEGIVNFLIYFEAIDYSFWGNPKWTIDTELGKKDGSDALLYSMLNYQKNHGTNCFSNISIEEFQNILKGNIEIPLLEERYNTLKEIGTIIKDKMNGNFYKYIIDITEDKDLFKIIIDNFPSFKDESIYKGKSIKYYKLAQLVTSDILHLRKLLEKKEVDYSHLVGCPDYKIPQTMRALEIINYNDYLANIVDNKQELALGSKEECEIRASMIVAINYLKEKLNNSNAMDINDYFFTLSKKVKSKTKPYHLCRNTKY